MVNSYTTRLRRRIRNNGRQDEHLTGASPKFSFMNNSGYSPCIRFFERTECVSEI